jgi:hypothetical protein
MNKTQKDKITFIEAVIEISKRDDLDMCVYRVEHEGFYDVCVHWKGSGFIGKLRWPRNDLKGEVVSKAHVDTHLETVLVEKLTRKQHKRRIDDR